MRATLLAIIIVVGGWYYHERFAGCPAPEPVTVLELGPDGKLRKKD